MWWWWLVGQLQGPRWGTARSYCDPAPDVCVCASSLCVSMCRSPPGYGRSYRTGLDLSRLSNSLPFLLLLPRQLTVCCGAVKSSTRSWTRVTTSAWRRKCFTSRPERPTHAASTCRQYTGVGSTYRQLQGSCLVPAGISCVI